MNYINFNLIGLVLITLGTFLIAFASNRVTNSSIRILEHIQKAYGLASMGPIDEKDKEIFRVSLKRGKVFSYIGWIIFVMGFILQILDNYI